MEKNGLFFTLFALLTTTVILLDFSSIAVNGEEGGAPDMPCKAAVSMLMKRQMGGITTCTKSMKFKNGKDKAAKMTCILKCVATNEGILTKDSMLDKDTVDKFIKKEIPRNLFEKAAPIVWNCYEGSVGKVDPAEEFCESYKPLMKCVMDAIPAFCKE